MGSIQSGVDTVENTSRDRISSSWFYDIVIELIGARTRATLFASCRPLLVACTWLLR
jgi:hypothetical protein